MHSRRCGPRIDALAGGIHYPDEECGDCSGFARALYQVMTGLDVEFRFNATIAGLKLDGDRVSAVETSSGTVTADRYVLAAGAESATIMARHGVGLPIIPVKGYSFTLSRARWPDAPELPVLDEAGKHGYMPLGPDRVRLTGYAEIAGYDTVPRERRKQAFIRSFVRLFPQLQKCFDDPHDEAFCCLRPVTPSGLPILGPSRLRNLIYNVGQGHLGWTLAHGCARIVADQVAERTPAIAMDGYLPNRRQ